MKKYLAGCALVLASTFATGAMANVSASLSAIAAAGETQTDASVTDTTGSANALKSISTSVATGDVVLSSAVAGETIAASASGAVKASEIGEFSTLEAVGNESGTSTITFTVADTAAAPASSE